MVSWNRINQLMSLGDVFDGFVGEFSANIKQWQDCHCMPLHATACYCTASKHFRTCSQISQPRVPQRTTKDIQKIRKVVYDVLLCFSSDSTLSNDKSLEQDVFDSDTPADVEWPNNFKLCPDCRKLHMFGPCSNDFICV